MIYLKNIKDTTQFNIKLNCKLEEIKDFLEKNHYKNIESYYQLNIYMIPEEIDILNVKNVTSLDTYILIQDIDGKNKKLIYQQDGNIYSGNVSEIIHTKNLLQKLNYNELMYLNSDIFVFYHADMDIQIELKEIKNQGLFFCTDKKRALDLLQLAHIDYETENLYLDNEEIALNRIQEELKKNMSQKGETNG